MICKNCGNNVEEGMKFCSNCGQPTEITINNEPPVEETTNIEQINNNIGEIINSELQTLSSETTAQVDVENDNQEINNSINNLNQEDVLNSQLTSSTVNESQNIIEEPITSAEDPNQQVNSIPANNIGEESNSNIQTNNTTISEPATSKKSGNKTGLIIGLSVGGLILLIGIIIGISLLFKSINAVQKTPTISIKIKTTTNASNETEKSNKNNTGNIGSNWKDYKVLVNGKTITLPCSYSDIVNATGAKMKEVQEENSLDKNYYSLANLYKNDKYALSIELLNDTSAPLKQKDAKVTRISQTKYNKTSIDVDITFPGNFKPGMIVTEEKIKEVLGEPTNVRNYDSDNYKSVTYTYNADSAYTTVNYYKIAVVNGVIDELTIDHRNY